MLILTSRLQGREFVLSFLCGNEVRISSLPDIQQLLIAVHGSGFVEMGLSACGAEKAKRIVRSLQISFDGSLLQTCTAIAKAGSEIR